MQCIEGEVQQVRCSACSASFPTFVFSGDTDVVTFGLEAATSVEPPFVVLGRLNDDEIRAGPSDGRERFANRMGQLLGAHLVALSVAHWPKGGSSEGMTFQQFRQVYRPPEPVYHCPNCGGDAEVTARLSPADFVTQGGRLELTEDLALA